MTDTSVKQFGKRPLVRVFQGEIGGLPMAVCDGRELHAFLQVGKRFASWMTERISEYGFVKNQDFLIISPDREKTGKGRPAKNYHINLDMAKELSMVEKNEKGREARRYFIAMERRALAQAQAQSTDQAHNLYRPQQPLSEAGRAVLKRFSTSRFLCSFDFDGRMGLHEIPHNAVVIPQDRLADFIGDPAGAPRETLGDILEAVARRVNTLN
jgi:phage anti-repressor protein